MYLLISSELWLAKSVMYKVSHHFFKECVVESVIKKVSYKIRLYNVDSTVFQLLVNLQILNVYGCMWKMFHMHPGSREDVLHMAALCKSNAYVSAFSLSIYIEYIQCYIQYICHIYYRCLCMIYTHTYSLWKNWSLLDLIAFKMQVCWLCKKKSHFLLYQL